MKKAVLAGAVVLAMTAIPAFAQTPDTKQTADKTMAGKNTGDQKFVMDVAHVGMAEVELGKMATEKGSNDQVKKFGQRMADDHAKAGDELHAIAQKDNMTWPTEMDAKHKAVHDRLSKLTGEGFDRAYMQEMVAGHRAAVNAFKMEAKSGKNPEIQAWATKKGVAAAGQRLAEDWERLVTFYAFPQAHWKHLRTTNVVESPFAAVRLRTGAAKRFKKVENATAVIWKTLGVAEQRFRRLDAPELLPDVAEGVVYVDGERVKRGNEKAAA